MREILIADPIANSAVAALQSLPADVTFRPDLTARQLAGAMSDVSILIVRSTSVDEAAIDAAPYLELIVRAGAGINSIDVNAATRKGIYVANCPGRNAAAVAELVIGLLLALDRRIVEATNDLRNGRWNKRSYAYGMGLAGNKFGILGLGATGQAVARAARGLGMEVVAWSKSLTPQTAVRYGIGFCATPGELARCADVVSIHLAADASTYHLIDRRFLSQMRDGAYLINTSRGEIVDTIALKEAIHRKSLRVALDVFEDEPAQDGPYFADLDLAQMIVATPHLAASTRQAMEAISREVVRVIGAYIGNGVPLNVINAPASKSAVAADVSFDFV
ncbi:MAG: NAD(P)-dependent oxidoreductase [Candidatus Promineifilaceae bacterium]